MSSNDVTDVIQTINLYAFATDSLQIDLFDRIFTDDVIADFGGGAVWKDRESLKRDFVAIHAPFDFTMHATTNHVVTVNGDQANALSYYQARFVRPVKEGENLFQTTGWYDDALICTSDGWRIRHRIARSNWFGGNLKVLQTMEGVTTEPPLSTTRKDAEAGELMYLKALLGG